MNNLQAYFFLDHKPELLVIVNRTVKELEEIIMLLDMGIIGLFDNIVYNTSEEKKK